MTRILSVLILLFSVGCAKSPYQVSPETRVRDGFFSPLSRRVVPYANLYAHQNHLFVGTRDGKLLCLDARDLDEVWEIDLKGTVTTTPAVAKNFVFAGTAQGWLYAIDLKTGEKRWEKDFPGAILGDLAVFQDRLLLAGVNDGALYALNPDDGRRVWRYSRDLPEEISIYSFAKPALNQARAYVGFWDGTVAALNIDSGEELWARRLPRTGRFVDIIAPLTHEDAKVFASQFFGSLHVTNEAGEDLKVLPEGGSGSKTVRDGEEMIVGTADNTIVAMNAETLEKTWTYESEERAAWSGLYIHKDKVLGTTFDGTLHVVHRETGKKIWLYDFHSSIKGSVVRAANRLWLLTERGGLFSLNLR